MDERRVHPRHLPHIAEIDDFRRSVLAFVRAPHHQFALAGLQQHAVLAGQSHGAGSRAVQPADDILVYRADQHHFHHVHGGVVGDALTLAEFRPDFQPAQHGVDLGAAAVDDDRMDAHQPEQRHIEGEGLLEGFVGHGVAAVLDDDDLILIAPQIGQALDENPGLDLRLFPCPVPLGDAVLRSGRHDAAPCIKTLPNQPRQGN